MTPHQFWIHEAVAEASKALGCTAPNPAVGAILVDNVTGQELGRGYHRGPGLPHAEVEALRAAQEKKEDIAFENPTALYVTLEPCSSHGRTGACTEVLKKAYHSHHLRKVIYGTSDPNPDHAGAADQILKKAGIEVISGEAKDQCQALIRGFAKRQLEQRPWIISKSALSLDGTTHRPEGESQWLTSPESRQHSQELRRQCDAVITGGKTARTDNPRLTYRPTTAENDANSPSKPPLLRVVISGQKNAGLSQEAHLLSDEFKSYTHIVPNLNAALELLNTKGVNRALLESGGQLTQAFAERGLIDEHQTYLAPLLTGTTPTPVFQKTHSPPRSSIQAIKNDLHHPAPPAKTK